MPLRRVFGGHVKTMQRVAVLGGVRIPFARQNTNYAEATNIEMLAAALRGVVNRFGLQGERLGEVAGGAVLKHSRDANISREAALDSGLSPQTPAYDVQQACGTSLETAILVGNKIAVGQIASGIAGGVDSASDAPIAVGEQLRTLILRFNRSKSRSERWRAITRFRPSMLVPSIPTVNERRTGLSMGEHCELMVKEWDIAREAQDELALASHQNGVRAYQQGFYDDLVVPFSGLTRDNNLRADASLETLATLKPAFDKTSGHGTLTAGNSTPLTDGAAAGTPLIGAMGGRPWSQAASLAGRRRNCGCGILRAECGRSADGADLRRAAPPCTKWPGPRGLRLLRDPRSLCRPGAVHAGGLGKRGLLPRQAGPAWSVRIDRPQPAQCERRLGGLGPSLCRHGCKDSGRRREATRTASCQDRAFDAHVDLDVHSRWPRGYGDSRRVKRRERALRGNTHSAYVRAPGDVLHVVSGVRALLGWPNWKPR